MDVTDVSLKKLFHVSAEVACEKDKMGVEL